MNRMAALIDRPAHPLHAPAEVDRRVADAPDPLADLKLFATGWVAGLIFFGTLFS